MFIVAFSHDINNTCYLLLSLGRKAYRLTDHKSKKMSDEEQQHEHY